MKVMEHLCHLFSRAAAIALLCTAALGAHAQESSSEDEEAAPTELSEGELIEDTFAPQTLAEARGAVLRGLDKITTETSDVELRVGQSARFGRVTVRLGECRAPAGNPNGDAFAWLEITDNVENRLVFSGWMIASAPALNALDHARIDIWVLRCTSS